MKTFHSSLKVTTAPESEPITLDQAKAYCRVYTDYEDSLIGPLITNARTMVEEYTARALITQTLQWTVKLAHDGSHHFGVGIGAGWPSNWFGAGGFFHTTFELPRSPVQSIGSVVVEDACGNLVTISDSFSTTQPYWAVDTSLDPARLCIYWNEVDTADPIIAFPIQHIQITFTAGYEVEPIPVPLTQAILLLTNYWYTRRADDADAPEIPRNVFWLLDQYRVYYTGATP